MKRNINDFADEITNNFSELFVETFLLRFLNEFDKTELLNGVLYARQELDKKIKKRFMKTLTDMGYSKVDIDKILK